MSVETSVRQQYSPEQSYPLFFKNPQVITTDRHASCKLKPDMTLAFAQATNFIPLTVADIPEAAKYYPIVFTIQQSIAPIAIVGFESDNYFVDKAGKWQERFYVPSYVRRYPFIFVESPENEQLTLCIDEDVVTFDAQAKGTALFADGSPSAFTQNALEFCAAYQEQHALTNRFCEMLQRHDLLLPQQSNITLDSGRTMLLEGFQLIDPDKFKSFSEAEAFDMYKQGFLALAYYVFQSQSNWKTLLDFANQKEEISTAF
jgi:hypothetical protein